MGAASGSIWVPILGPSIGPCRVDVAPVSPDVLPMLGRFGVDVGVSIVFSFGDPLVVVVGIDLSRPRYPGRPRT